MQLTKWRLNLADERLWYAAHLIARLVFAIWIYDAASFLTQMPLNLDLRAMSLINGQSQSNLTAWGSLPLFLAPLYKVLQLVGLIELRLQVVFALNSLAQLATLALSFRLLRRLHGGVAPKWATIGVGLFFSFDLVFIFLGSLVVSESLYLLVSTLALTLFLELNENSRLRTYAAFGALAGFSVLLRNIFLPFIPVLGVLILLKPATRAKNFRSGWLVAAGTLLAVYVTAAMINSRFDSDHVADISRNRGVNFAQTWCQATQITYETDNQQSFWFSPPSFWSLEKTQSIFSNTPFSDQAHYVRMGMSCLASHPERILLQLRALVNLFDGPLYPDFLYSPREIAAKKAVAWLHLLLFSLALSVAAVSLVDFRRHFERLVLSGFLLAQLAAILLANPGEQRFRYSILVPMLLLGFSPRPRTMAIRVFKLTLAGLILCVALIPSTEEWIIQSQWRQFDSLSEHELNEEMTKRSRLVFAARSKVSPPFFAGELTDVCPEFSAQLEGCTTSISSGPATRHCQAQLNLIASQTKPTVFAGEMFCRAWASARLAQENNNTHSVSLPIYEPLSEMHDLSPTNYNLQRIAAQLIITRLLETLEPSKLPNDYVSSKRLLFELMRFQYRYDYNPPSYSGHLSSFLYRHSNADYFSLVFSEALEAYKGLTPETNRH